MAQSTAASPAKLALTLIAFGIASIPFAGYTWEVLSDLLSGEASIGELALGALALFILAIILRFAARRITRLGAPDA